MNINKMIKSGVVIGILSAGLIASSVYAAAEQDVYFGAKGHFYCVATGSGNVTIDTHQLDAQGFCAGMPNVTSAGHIKITAAQLNQYNFGINSNHGLGHVSVNSDDGVTSMSCTNGSISSREDYASGADYCALPPKK